MRAVSTLAIIGLLTLEAPRSSCSASIPTVSSNVSVAYFSLGCFWTSEFNFECSQLKGLRKKPDKKCPTGSSSVSDKMCTPESTVVGYMGGTGEYPNYYNYTANLNNYSETVRLEYDSSLTTFAELLEAYWQFVPDPTAPCDDVAYCPRIFTVDSQQKQLAVESLAAHQAKTNKTILLKIVPADEYTFWKAEERHQDFDRKEGMQC